MMQILVTEKIHHFYCRNSKRSFKSFQRELDSHLNSTLINIHSLIMDIFEERLKKISYIFWIDYKKKLKSSRVMQTAFKFN